MFVFLLPLNIKIYRVHPWGSTWLVSLNQEGTHTMYMSGMDRFVKRNPDTSFSCCVFLTAGGSGAIHTLEYRATEGPRTVTSWSNTKPLQDDEKGEFLFLCSTKHEWQPRLQLQVITASITRTIICARITFRHDNYLISSQKLSIPSSVSVEKKHNHKHLSELECGLSVRSWLWSVETAPESFFRPVETRNGWTRQQVAPELH